MDDFQRENQTKQWGLFLHLSLLAGFIVPLAGLVTPIVIWQLKKNDLPGLDIHGKNVVNWIISDLIYMTIGSILCLVVIGIPILITLGIVSVIFPIIGGIKANNGEVWKYPLTMRFVK